MTACEVLVNIGIGVVSGIISSILVTQHYRRKEAIEDFVRDRQSYHRYILLIRSELFIAFQKQDKDSLIISIENEPILYSFSNMTERSAKDKSKIDEFIKKMRNELEKNSTINEEVYKRWHGMLFKYSVDALKLERKKKWYESIRHLSK